MQTPARLEGCPFLPDNRLPTIGILFSQFAAYHVDRCEAAAARLSDRYEVKAVEVATRSVAYAWEPSSGVPGATKLTLFPGQSFEDVPWPRRMWAEFEALRHCSHVFVGLPYSLPDAIGLSWLLRAVGVRVVVLTESKHDDRVRQWPVEFGKRLRLGASSSAVVGARRQRVYLRDLGFRRRPVLPGYDAVSTERVRAQVNGAVAPAWGERPFVYVGRFVEKKNLEGLLRGYARYVALAVEGARPLRLVGDGDLRASLQALAGELGVADRVEWTGFLGAEAVSQQLASSLALCLVSRVEQWGLVVNEALALGLPVIVSTPVGARDALVREGGNGYVVEPDDHEALARAMLELGSSREHWDRLSAASAEWAWLGDAERFADAVELTLEPGAQPAGERIAAFEREIAGP
jgi:glycosyltransferase involved in cell wall biosynthesis